MMLNKSVVALCIASVAFFASTVDASTEVALNDNAIYRNGDADGYNAPYGYDDDGGDDSYDPETDGNGRRLTGRRSYERSRYVSSERYNNRNRGGYGGDRYSSRYSNRYSNRYSSSHRNSYDRDDNSYN